MTATAAATWPRDSLGLASVGVEVEDARDWLARISATNVALARVQAGWIARADDLALACAFAERVTEDTDHADLLFKRQHGLRAFMHEMERDSRLVPAWVAELEAAPNPLTCLVALYRIVKPRLLVELRRYRARTDHNADGPTVRQLDLVEPELERQIAWAEDAIDAAGTLDPEALAGAATWAARFEATLVNRGGFFGETAVSDGALWCHSAERQAERPAERAMRDLARVVYAGFDLPWDAVLGLAKHLGDLGRHVRRLAIAAAPPRGRVVARKKSAAAPELPGSLRQLADTLDALVAGSRDEADEFVAAAARVAARHARTWAARLDTAAAEKAATQPTQ